MHLALVGQKDALAGYVGNLIEQLVHGLESEVRHADAVNVRITEGNSQPRAALQRPARIHVLLSELVGIVLPLPGDLALLDVALLICRSLYLI